MTSTTMFAWMCGERCGRTAVGQGVNDVRTSQTHPIYVDWFPHNEGEGKIGMTLCPGKYQPISSTGSWDRQLDDDLDDLKAMGVDRIISLITEEDMVILRVESLGEEIQARGMKWDHLPFPDTTAPTQAWMERAAPVFDELQISIPNGETVVVHCMGGLSRAGTFLSIHLWKQGFEMNVAIHNVRDVRSPHCINPEQRLFLQNLSRTRA